MMGGRGFFPVYHRDMDILFIMIFTLCFLVALCILNLLFGPWDYGNVVYQYEREIRYEEPPF